VDLPGAGASAGLPDQVDLVVSAAERRDEVVLVAQSMGAFTALGAFGRLRAGSGRKPDLVDAMNPAPGETPGNWWANTGWDADRVAAPGRAYTPRPSISRPTSCTTCPRPSRRQAPSMSATTPTSPSPSPATSRDDRTSRRSCSPRGDRFFPGPFQRRVARERIGIEAREVPGGHLSALSEPDGLAAAVLGSA
jgi:pimeloyl-ACP methyl ester carboxylesterase